jgi:hypothetical protein
VPVWSVCSDRRNARLAVWLPQRQRARPRSPIYAEVACTGRVFVDSRGVRAQRIEILRLATSAPLWPDPGLQAQAVGELRQRYCVQVCGLGVVPQWVVTNVMPQGAPPEDVAIDLDVLPEVLDGGRRALDDFEQMSQPRTQRTGSHVRLN